MRQLTQRLDTGATALVDVPPPGVSARHLVIETRASVVSPGTERMVVSFGRSNLVQKARQQPHKVRQVLDKVRTDGIGPTVEAVRSKLEDPLPLGYSNAGVVSAVGADVPGFRVGDRVVSNGPHSEVVRVARTLAARIPDSVDFATAAFTPLGAIGLQGVRLARPTLGETVVVYGLGLIGLLTVQVLRANGCRVIGVDLDPARVGLAERFGATGLLGGDGEPVQRVEALTGGIGADAVLLTLSAASSDPVHQSAAMCRKRGRIVLVGVTGLELRREDFYEKELSFSVSCSYGPGRYDPSYEEQGVDYPPGFVRWTEQRNFEAVLTLMAEGALDVQPLITHRVAFGEAPSAYDSLLEDRGALGIVLEYMPASQPEEEGRGITLARQTEARPGPSVGVIGAGTFANRTILPALRKTGARLHMIASSGGRTAAVAGRKFGFERATSSSSEALEADVVFVLTPHGTHARLAADALSAGKHVFVEKPLALTLDELERVERAAEESGRLLMVGFNRRFARDAAVLSRAVRHRSGPLALVITVNAGFVPAEHWIQDESVGGGRIVGEACHWMDLSRFLVGSRIRGVSVVAARGADGDVRDDIAHLTLSFEDGSTAVINYLANGSPRYPKERIEAHFDGKSGVIDNWRGVSAYGWSGGRRLWRQPMDKGHEEEVGRWMQAVAGNGPVPIPPDEIFEVSRWAIHAAGLARGGGGARES